MTIQAEKSVTIHYTLTTDQGDVIDSSIGGEPLNYTHGVGMLIPGLENELEGKSVGAKFKTRIEAKDAYGDRNEEAFYKLPKSGYQAEDGEELVIGLQVEIETENGPALAFVSNIEGDEVTLDLNHPLAGVPLNFEVEVMEIEAA